MFRLILAITQLSCHRNHCEAGGAMMRRTEPPDPAGRELTPRRRRIVEVIEDSVQRYGYAPSMREIGEAAGLASTSSVAYQLAVLEKEGYLSRAARRPRTAALRTLARPAAGPAARPAVAPVPRIGRIAAGGPILAEQLIEEIVPLPKQLVGEGELIILTVVGDSMIDAAIANGDWVVVRRNSDVEDGDIVAAMIVSDTSADQEATVKTFRRRDGHIWLIPHNPAYTPILGDHATIVGKVVAVLRRV
jgi:repressor LexA